MPEPFVEDAFFFSLFIFSFFLRGVKTQVFIGMWTYVRVFDSIPLIHVSIFVPISNCFYYYSSIVQLDVKNSDASRSSFIVQDCFSFPRFFAFPYQVEYCSFQVCEELCWDFDGDCIDSVDCFW